ncbi:hypothetical protein J5N97_000577 [Dioscorea zingiberensis]|uniref:Uncharacterized protein n=1 Tax=Dioscorea zingiberensis TaxID=325984 RepID=A0A9D5BSD5_9LILI|nr:hypothetical protein J5N97_000577 [Dioscorea zingiberensis]
MASLKSKSDPNSLAVTVFDENVACDEHARPLNFVDSRSAFSAGLPELAPAPEMARKDGVREMQEHRSLRRSPRLSPLPDLPSPSKKARGSLGNVAIDNCVRRSPRLASADVEAGKGKTFVQVIKEVGSFHDKRRLFYSTVVGLKVKSIASPDFYYDMEYCIDYSTFRTLVTGELGSSHHQLTENNSLRSHSFSSSNLIEMESTLQTAKSLGNSPSCDTYNAEFSLLDLYCGCGGMSTGLCLGAKLSSVNLVTKWALDSDKSACESLKLNHPETHVRNEAAEDFLELLKEWEKLCRQYEVDNVERTNRSRSETSRVPKHNDETEFEVSRIIDICYGDPNKTGKRGVNFRVRWKGYGSSDAYMGTNWRLKVLPLVVLVLWSKFRDLPGVVVGRDNVARRDLTEKQSVLPSGKPLIVSVGVQSVYIMYQTMPSLFEQGKSKRLYYILSRTESSLSENVQDCKAFLIIIGSVARLERYCQVGNAVAIPVARALGYALGLAVHKSSGNEPLLTLPKISLIQTIFQFTEILPPP